MRARMPAATLLVAMTVAALAACGGATAPTSPSAVAGTPTPARTGASPTETLTPSVPVEASPSVPATPEPLPTELVLGQTFGLVYHPAIERVVLVNGAREGASPRPTELWSWTGTAWELVDASGPEARSFAAIAFDPDRGTIVIHGGLTGSGTALDETVEWDGRDWTVHAWDGEGPGAREGAGLAWDEAGERLILFGGAENFEQRGDTWGWDGTEWARVAEAGPQPRFIGLLTDTRSGGVLLQGGHWVDGNDGGFLADTWTWDGDAWTEVTDPAGPGPRVNSPGAWDGNREGVVLFGGGREEGAPPAADTWLWDGEWREIDTATSPPARNGHAIAFDDRRDVLVLVGGLDRPGGSQELDVWELDADGWREVLAND